MNLSRQIARELRQTGVTILVQTCPLRQTVSQVEVTFKEGSFNVSMVTLHHDGSPRSRIAGSASWKTVLRAIKGYARERRKQN